MSLKELVLTVASFQIGILLGLVVLVGRLRDRVTKLEEWSRLQEKRINGQHPG